MVDPEDIGDSYSPYNKPYGVMSWLQDADPVGDFFMIVDSDMTFHRYNGLHEQLPSLTACGVPPVLAVNKQSVQLRHTIGLCVAGCKLKRQVYTQ